MGSEDRSVSHPFTSAAYGTCRKSDRDSSAGASLGSGCYYTFYDRIRCASYSSSYCKDFTCRRNVHFQSSTTGVTWTPSLLLLRKRISKLFLRQESSLKHLSGFKFEPGVSRTSSLPGKGPEEKYGEMFL